MPSFRRRASVIDADRVDEPPQDPGEPADAAEALALAEEAEAEAAEAEAVAAAARARARAIRLRGRPKPLEATRRLRCELRGRRGRNAKPRTPELKPPKPTDVETEVDDGRARITEDGTDGKTKKMSPRSRRTKNRSASDAAGELGRILKILAAALAVACTAALVTLSVLMVHGPPPPGRRTAAPRGVRRSSPAERRDTDVAGLQQGEGRRTAHHRQLDRPVQGRLQEPSGRLHQGRAGLEGGHRGHCQRHRASSR